MTNISFEMIWEAAEDLYKTDASNVQVITTEIMAKLMVYKSIDGNKELDGADKVKAKQYIMGKILLVLSQLTAKDNLNIYPILKDAIATYRTEKIEKEMKL